MRHKWQCDAADIENSWGRGRRSEIIADRATAQRGCAAERGEFRDVQICGRSDYPDSAEYNILVKDWEAANTTFGSESTRSFAGDYTETEPSAECHGWGNLLSKQDR